MRIRGRVWKFGSDVDTDLIIPARYCNVSEGAQLAANCFADLRPDFAAKVSAGDIIIAGKNFGCGSSREHAPLAIKTAGVAAIIAESFARIFYRNAFNIGLLLLEAEKAGKIFRDGEQIEIDLDSGKITSLESGKHVQARPVPEFIQKLVESGGLVEYIKKNKLKKRKRI
jgi:3-isopropylmalate/(R)-2-methylmalate dehydratase small subunit